MLSYYRVTTTVLVRLTTPDIAKYFKDTFKCANLWTKFNRSAKDQRKARYLGRLRNVLANKCQMNEETDFDQNLGLGALFQMDSFGFAFSGNTLDVDGYDSGEYSVDVTFAKFYFTIYFVEMPPSLSSTCATMRWLRHYWWSISISSSPCEDQGHGLHDVLHCRDH